MYGTTTTSPIKGFALNVSISEFKLLKLLKKLPSEFGWTIYSYILHTASNANQYVKEFL